MPYQYYAVAKGHKPGIYLSWDECKKQVTGFKGQEYKGFNNLAEAELFIQPKIEIKMDNAMIAYCDGSYSDKLEKYGSGGIILNNMHEFSFSGSDPNLVAMRNVAGEIEASRYVMNYAIQQGYKCLKLYYDYEGIAKWCTGAWRAKCIGTQKYRDYYLSIANQLQIEFIHVDGHSGNRYNDISDSLAKKSLGL